jgi:hypothetical protein
MHGEGRWHALTPIAGLRRDGGGRPSRGGFLTALSIAGDSCEPEVGDPRKAGRWSEMSAQPLGLGERVVAVRTANAVAVATVASLLSVGLGAGRVALAAHPAATYTPGATVSTTLSGAQRLVRFTIRTPRYVPASLRLTSVVVGYPQVANAPKAVVVTLFYAASKGAGMQILEVLGHQPPGLPRLDGIPYTMQARPKTIPGAPNQLTMYFGDLLCSLTSARPMTQLERIAVSLSPFRTTKKNARP